MPNPQSSITDSPEITSLTSRTIEQNKALDHWNDLVIIALIAAALAAIFVVTFQRLANVQAKNLSETQDKLAEAKDAAFKLEIKTKDAELATELKAKDEKIAQALADAATANDRAKASEANIAEAQAKLAEHEVETEKLKAQNLTLETNLELEKKERLRMEREQAPRTLSDAQVRSLQAGLAGHSRTISIHFPINDSEAERFGGILAEVLARSGWTIIARTYNVRRFHEGIALHVAVKFDTNGLVSLDEDSTVLMRALESANLKPTFDPGFANESGQNEFAPADCVLLVGSKPWHLPSP